jgi:NADPH:quinone reductase-like Zn-dependent oxidoreductase
MAVRAVIVERSGGVEHMRTGELPVRSAASGQVRVRVEAAGVNPVDAFNRADPDWSATSSQDA